MEKKVLISFGILFFIVFLIISIWPVLKRRDLKNLVTRHIPLIFLILEFWNSKILASSKTLDKVWWVLGKIISPYSFIL